MCVRFAKLKQDTMNGCTIGNRLYGSLLGSECPHFVLALNLPPQAIISLSPIGFKHHKSTRQPAEFDLL